VRGTKRTTCVVTVRTVTVYCRPFTSPVRVAVLVVAFVVTCGSVPASRKTWYPLVAVSVDAVQETTRARSAPVTTTLAGGAGSWVLTVSSRGEGGVCPHRATVSTARTTADSRSSPPRGRRTAR
jgi:hypothetical protein